MFGTPCAVHSLNLSLKAIIVKFTEMKKHCDKEKEI